MSLVINYIEIENFKSYYGKNILGPFHTKFNSTIGPNGSGKSNVIDSLLFVFGFRAQKIRSKKLSVLIHNSEKYQNVNSCSVTIYFHKINEDQELIPNTEFTIKRTAYRDSSSDYSIDDRLVSFKDVQKLLVECGVDLDHNRFLILQGEVEQISLLKPKAANEHEEGLLEYLEDIIGTIQYRPTLAQMANEIDKVNEIRAEKFNRVNNLQKDKNSLEGPKNEALQYLRKENELFKKQNIMYQIKACETQKMVDKEKENFDKVKSELDDINENLGKFQSEFNEVKEECERMKKEFDRQTKQSDKMKKTYEDLEKEDITIRESLKHSQEQIKKLKKNIEAEKEKIKKYESIPGENPAKIEECEERLKELQEEREEVAKKLDKLMDKVNVETREWQEQRDNKQKELTELQKKVDEFKAKMALSQSELDAHMENYNYEQNKVNEIKQKLEELRTAEIQRNTDINDLLRDIPKMEHDLAECTNELNTLNQREKTLTEKVRKSREKYGEAQSSYASNGNKNRVLAYLMQLKAEGKLPGVYGRLGDLGAIGEKFDIAISTACGALDCILTDTVDTAQKCVEHLKRGNVGVGNFLALDKQEKWRENLKKKTGYPENAQRLVDLIKVNDETLLTAFYSSLRNTLVANDSAQANRIGFGEPRYRVVTLAGAVIEISGTISGGGRPLKGRMGNKIAEEFTAEQVREMQLSMAKDEQELNEVTREKQELEARIYTLRTKLEQSKDNLTRWKQEHKSIVEQKNALQRGEVEAIKKLNSIRLDQNVKHKLEQTIDKHKREYEKADTIAGKCREKIEELNQKIVEINKRILDKPKETLAKIDDDLKKTSDLLTNLNVEIKTASRNLAISENKLESIQGDLEAYEAREKECKERLMQMDEEGKSLIERHETLKQELQRVEKELKEKLKSNKESEKRTHTLEANKLDLAHKLEKINEKLFKQESELKYTKHACEKLKLHQLDLDNFEKPSEPLKQYTTDELEEIDGDQIISQIEGIEEDLKKLSPNVNAVHNYIELQKKFIIRVNELDLITQQRDEIVTKFEETRQKRHHEFMHGFHEIKKKLKEIYRTITIEGDAELELVDTLDPFTEGIVLSVRPPKKSWKNVGNLSGGEKTLSSLSLVFALHEFRATPIYVMDEIDAALDFKNVSIIAHYIKERTRNAQFIIISLRNNMFELADRLFGIYKVNNCTSATYINPAMCELDEKLKKASKKQKQTALSSVTQQPAQEEMSINQ